MSFNKNRMIHIIRLVLLAKILSLLFVFALEKDLIYVGDRAVLATETRRGEARQTQDSRDGSGGTRRSFMDDLLNLPRIDGSDLRREEAARYLDLVERRRQQVEERINLLQQREDLLKQLEDSVEDKLKKLEEERRFFAETVQHEKKIKQERLDQLVEFYRGMPPKQAAPVMERLDRDVVVHLFQQLPQKQITGILAAMDPQISVELTEYFGRLRSGREYDLLREVNASLVEAFQDCKGM